MHIMPVKLSLSVVYIIIMKSNLLVMHGLEIKATMPVIHGLVLGWNGLHQHRICDGVKPVTYTQFHDEIKLTNGTAYIDSLQNKPTGSVYSTTCCVRRNTGVKYVSFMQLISQG